MRVIKLNYGERKRRVLYYVSDRQRVRYRPGFVLIFTRPRIYLNLKCVSFNDVCPRVKRTVRNTTTDDVERTQV